MMPFLFFSIAVLWQYLLQMICTLIVLCLSAGGKNPQLQPPRMAREKVCIRRGLSPMSLQMLCHKITLREKKWKMVL